jgi:hypothetical protein
VEAGFRANSLYRHQAEAVTITPQLRAMLDAKEEKKRALERQRRLNAKWNYIVAETFALIDKAAPFMDEDCAPKKWPPSALLKIAYFALSTSPRHGGEKDATLFILSMLDRARKLWVGGFHPNPFLADEELVRR